MDKKSMKNPPSPAFKKSLENTLLISEVFLERISRSWTPLSWKSCDR